MVPRPRGDLSPILVATSLPGRVPMRSERAIPRRRVACRLSVEPGRRRCWTRRRRRRRARPYGPVGKDRAAAPVSGAWRARDPRRRVRRPAVHGRLGLRLRRDDRARLLRRPIRLAQARSMRFEARRGSARRAAAGVAGEGRSEVSGVVRCAHRTARGRLRPGDREGPTTARMRGTGPAPTDRPAATRGPCASR